MHSQHNEQIYQGGKPDLLEGNTQLKRELLSQGRNYGKDCPTQCQGFTSTPRQDSWSPQYTSIQNLVLAAQVFPFIKELVDSKPTCAIC